jgi:hypothetical protein
MTDELDYSWLIQEAKKLAAQWEFGEATSVAMAVVCLDRIVDQLAEIAEQLGNINYEFEAHRGLHKADESMEDEPPQEGLGYGGVVRSHHDGD